ncbi:hypothetical protein, conserved [Leishmania tarentolae]|uniref:Uncharacterized protein n=1 Tax=Leishmania tarentolae TaxID=5689 RepID=A0A640KJY7_LEITA|nr:hypothetical protein, conserved [Leishmania tarentolae]
MGEVDYRRLLWSGRENPPPSLLQSSPSSSTQQLSGGYTTVAVAREASNGTSGTTMADGANSEPQGSFFSRLSFSGWTRTAASRSNANRSPMVAALLRPFQYLRMWCCDRCRGCRACLGIGSSWFSGFESSTDDVDDVVPIANVNGDALGDSSVSRGCGDETNTRNTTPNTIQKARISPSHVHRRYAPPRSRPSEVRGVDNNAPAASTSPRDHLDLVREGGPLPPSDSLDGRSVAGSSTPPSSLSFSRQPRVQGECGEGQFIMRRGVLVRVAADGSSTRVSETPAYSSGCHNAPPSMHLSGRTNDSPVLHLGQPGLLTDACGHADSRSTAGDMEDTSRSYAVAMALAALEARRKPLRTLEEISAALTMCAPYLPLRVEVEADLNSSAPISPVATGAMLAETELPSTPSTRTPASPSVPLYLHVLGPLLSCPTAQGLRTLEGILLEDCDESRLPLCALHCADLDLRRSRMDDDSVVTCPTNASAAPRAQSNAFLDLLLSPTSEAHTSCTASVSQLLAFMRRIVATRCAQLTTLRFTRCCVSPHDVGQSIPLPLATLRRLRFEHCSLTPAHVAAILALARQQDALASSKVWEARGLRGSWSSHKRSFGILEELQLSGSLTPECITELLDYVEEQQTCREDGGQKVSFRLLCVPSSVVCAASAHPFVQANGSHISVVSAQV